MLRFFLLIILILSSGCTFKPLASSGEKLEEVEIRNVSAEDSQVLRSYLLNLFDFYNLKTVKSYVMDVVVTSNVSNAIIQKDSTIIEKRIILNSTFVMYGHGGKELVSGNTRIAADYSDLQSPYSSYLKGQKIYHEALKQIAEDVKRQVIIYFVTNKHKNENTSSKH